VLPDVVLVLAVLVLAVDGVDPAGEELPGAGLVVAVCVVVAACVVVAVLPDVAGVDELDAVPASPFFFDFLLFVDFVVELVSCEVVEDWLGVV
jgi:hypothetical protein